MRYVTWMVIAVSLFATVSARADELIRKGGEWQSTITGVLHQPQTMVMCFSQMTWEQALAQSAARQQNCAKKNFSRDGNRVMVDIDCGAVAIQGAATLMGDSAYTTDMTMRMGAGADAKVVHVTTESKWIGPCKPGEKVMN
jgi:hypothetical protein